jgi:hypothetical protein
VYNMLPAGRSVAYKLADEDETIPSIPQEAGLEPGSAITAASDAIVEEGKKEEGRGDLLVPFVPYARQFYLPQWVAFDENGALLVKSVEEAGANIRSMQRFMEVLFLAVALAPYFSVDREYVAKRYGMLGQLVNQGRALAIYQAKEIIARIQERASSGNLNRGLSLSLPEIRGHSRGTDHVRPCVCGARGPAGGSQGQPGYAPQPIDSQTFAPFA